MNAIGELFTYVYNRKKKEKQLQELENRQNNQAAGNFDQSITDNSQSSHTLVDDKQPQNQGFNNEALMEFLKQQQEKINSQQSNSQTLPTPHLTGAQNEFNKELSSTYSFPEPESRYAYQPNKFSTLPLPPPRAESNCSNYSNYSSNTNLNSYYDSSSHYRPALNNYQSELSLATQGSCSEMQQIQNVISSARKANDKFANWQMFEDTANDEFGSNSLISEKDENDSMADDNWANFSPPEPNYPPPPLYLSNSNEELSLATDTNTLTNDQSVELHQQSSHLNQPANQQPMIQPPNQPHQFNPSSNPRPSNRNSLNNSQNSTAFVIKLDTPPASARRRRSARLSEGSSADNRDKISNETKGKQIAANQFESNFNQTGNEFFDKANNRAPDRVQDGEPDRAQDRAQPNRSQSLSKGAGEFGAFDLSRAESSRTASRNESRASSHYKESGSQFDSFDNQLDKHFDNKFDSKFDKNFDNQQRQCSTGPKFDQPIMQLTGVSMLNSFDTVNSDTNLSNENSSTETSANYGKLANYQSSQQYSSIDSAVSLNQNCSTNAQLNRMSFSSSVSDKKLSLDIVEFNPNDSSDKYAAFNDINSMKLSIFSNQDSERIHEDDQVFLAGVKEHKGKQTTSTSSLNKMQSFEDSFLANSSLNQSKDASFNSAGSKTTDQPQSKPIDAITSLYSSTVTDPELLESHKKFLQERQEKLNQIDKIFEEEKEKILSKQRELNAQHIKQQKNLLNQQKTYQQEFYQRQKQQRQTILHQLQIQRLPVAQFDQCKLQLQQKLKNDQRQLQAEFVKKQQELKKQQIEEQKAMIQQYKVLEEQYLEKQGELLNSDFEIEIDLPDLPNIFDNDESLQNEQTALTKRFELSLKNEFDKLTNEIIQTTTSSLNSSPKMSERCSTACSIASSSSRHNPFVSGEDTTVEKSLFEDFDKALNLLDTNRQSFDFYSFGSNDSSKENSLDYFRTDLNKSLNNDLSSLNSLETNRSSSTLPAGNRSFVYRTVPDNTSSLNKSLNNEPFKRPTLNQIGAFRSQQQLGNSLPKSLESSFNSQFGAFTNPSRPVTNQPNQPTMLPQTFDPFNSSYVDTKLNEMNRIKELRQHTQQNLGVSLTMPGTTGSQTTQATTQVTSTSSQSIGQERPVCNQPKKEAPVTSIQELEDLLGLSTSRSSNLNAASSVKSDQSSTGFLNKSLNLSLNSARMSSSPSQAASRTLDAKPHDLFDNLFDLKKNSSLVNFANSDFQPSKPSSSLLVNDHLKKSSMSYQDLRSDYRTKKFMNSLQENSTSNLLPSLEQKNSLEVFGTVCVGDLNNKSSAKQLFNQFKQFNHFDNDHISPQERNIFTNKDPFKEDAFFN